MRLGCEPSWLETHTVTAGSESRLHTLSHLCLPKKEQAPLSQLVMVEHFLEVRRSDLEKLKLD